MSQRRFKKQKQTWMYKGETSVLILFSFLKLVDTIWKVIRELENEVGLESKKWTKWWVGFDVIVCVKLNFFTNIKKEQCLGFTKL